MNKMIIILLSVLLTNNINANNDEDLATKLRQHFIGETHQEENCDSEESTYNQTDSIQEEYEDLPEKHQNEFLILQKRAPLLGLSGICLVIGIVILLNKLYS